MQTGKKIILIAITFLIGAFLIAALKQTDLGILWVIALVATFAATNAIWKYKPENKNNTLDKS